MICWRGIRSVRMRLRQGLFLKQMCLGHCVAHNYYMHHDLLAGHTFCEDAVEAGVFPETRLSPQ